MLVRKAVIPAAGIGTRLFPATKEEPKEMLPVFAKGSDGKVCVKPLLQVVFENLSHGGIREYCIITGRSKRAIEDHFTQDMLSLEWLEKRGKEDAVEALRDFYAILEESTIIWVNQPEPKGFGDAVSKAELFAGNEPCLVHAGDTLILSRRRSYVQSLIDTHVVKSSEATFYVKAVEKPQLYGVVESEDTGQGILRVERVVEKPKVPPSNLAVVPIYAFNPIIFKALEKTQPDEKGEKQLTDAIQTLIEWGRKVYAVQLGEDEEYLDIGTPETYWYALKKLYEST